MATVAYVSSSDIARVPDLSADSPVTAAASGTRSSDHQRIRQGESATSSFGTGCADVKAASDTSS